MYVLGIVTEGWLPRAVTNASAYKSQLLPSYSNKFSYATSLEDGGLIIHGDGEETKNNCPCHKSLSEYCDKGSYLLNFEVTYSHFCVLREATHASRYGRAVLPSCEKKAEYHLCQPRESCLSRGLF